MRATGNAEPPVLSIYGGKLTTYRKLAEAAMLALKPWFPTMKPAWTEGDTLPGGDLPQRDRTAWIAELGQALPGLPAAADRATSGAATARSRPTLLGDAKTMADLGRDFGGGLTEREVDYVVRNEWATTADDVLWRRTKCGLWLDGRQRAAVAAHVGA